MRSVTAFFIFLVLVTSCARAQSPAPPAAQQKQTPPTKENPQGYSKEMFDEEQKSSLGHPPVYSPAPARVPKQEIPADLAEIVKKEFGPDYALALKKSSGNGYRYLHETEAPWTTYFTGDLNGDGVEDVVIVARAKSPLAGETTYHYKAIDPYFTAYGYGDVKITSTLASEDPDNRNLVLVIHGVGAEAWRSPAAKTKFVILNLPIENLMVRKATFKKRVVDAIDPQSPESNGAVVMWDGKKYRWLEANGK